MNQLASFSTVTLTWTEGRGRIPRGSNSGDGFSLEDTTTLLLRQLDSDESVCVCVGPVWRTDGQPATCSITDNSPEASGP